jgi:HTH-type transcriptional regulator / antitoxin HipB
MLIRQPDDLAGLFRDGRSRAGWSQTQLADQAGVSRQWVSSVETGKTSVEFDLVVGVLHVLGYELYVASPEQASAARVAQPLEIPTHSGTGRTPLTRRGESLGTPRSRRRPRGRNRGESG